MALEGVRLGSLETHIDKKTAGLLEDQRSSAARIESSLAAVLAAQASLKKGNSEKFHFLVSSTAKIHSQEAKLSFAGKYCA